MKKIAILISSVLLIIACGGTDQNEVLQEDISNEVDTNIEKIEVKCDNKVFKTEDTDSPYEVKTCLINNYKVVKNAFEDYHGRSYYKYQFYKMHNENNYVEVKLIDLFNSKKNELLAEINSKIKNEFDLLISNPEDKECFGDMKFKNVDFEDLGIDFNEQEVTFIYSFGLGGACMYIDLVSVNFKVTDITKYLNE